MPELLLRQMSLLKAQGLYISQVNLNFIESKEELNEMQKECIEELELLKSQKFDASTLCYFDILTIKSNCELSGFVRNKNVAKVKSSDCESKYPIYGKMNCEAL